MKILCKCILLILLLFNFKVFSQSEAEVWKFKTKGVIYSTPVIYDNVVYAGSLDSNLYAIDTKTGTEKWHYKTGNRIHSSAAANGNIVCIESGNQLYTLDLQGNLLWKAVLCGGAVTNQYDTWDYFHSSPVIHDGKIYICSEKGLVYGFAIETGDTVFFCKTDKANGIRTTPAIFNNKIYFGDYNGIFYAYDLTTCQKVWEYDTYPERLWTGGAPAIITDPVIYNNSVYFAGKCCILYSLDAETGVSKWKYLSPTNQWLVGGPAIEDTLLLLGSSDQHILCAFNSKTGALLWKTTFDCRIFSTPLIDGDNIYLGTGIEASDNVGSFYILDKLTGKIKSRFTINRQTHSSPVISEGIIYTGSADGYLYAIDKQKLLNLPFPATDFKESGDISLGDIYKDTTITVTVFNNGNASDEISVTTIKSNPLRNAIKCEPTKFTIAPHDSQKIEMTILASAVQPASGYSVTLQIKSKDNLDFSKLLMSKKFLFNVITPTEVKLNENILPDKFHLFQNYPNPFNPLTVISYQVPVGTRRGVFVQIKVYDTLGRVVAVLVKEQKTAGVHKVEFNASSLSSGIYFYALNAESTDGSESYKDMKKLVLLK